MKLFITAVRRDLRAQWRRPAELLNPLIFFIIVLSLFPLGIGPAKEALSLVAPGLLWVAALLAALMSMDLIFKSDFDDGSLEQMLVSTTPFPVIILAKITAHWLLVGLPLVLVTPLLALMLYVDAQGMRAMTLSILLVSPTLSLIGSVGAALTVGLPRGGLLVAILVLPIYVPVLILATAMVATGLAGGDYTGHIYWLAAILFLSLGLAPIASAAGIRISLED